MEYKEVTVKLAYEDRMNKNGWRIHLADLKAALNEEEVQEKLAEGTLYITKKYDFSSEISEPVLISSNVIGHVRSINLDDLTAVIIIDNSTDYREDNLLYLGYTGLIEKLAEEPYSIVTDLHIITAVYMSKSFSAYN